MLYIIGIIWQFPQFILGLIMRAYYKDIIVKDYLYGGKNLYILKNLIGVPAGFSLGQFLFIRNDVLLKDQFVKDHELGHSIQSIILGPLYLLVVGIPSAIMNYYSRKDSEYRKAYYKRWPESWADSLSKIKRT